MWAKNSYKCGMETTQERIPVFSGQPVWKDGSTGLSELRGSHIEDREHQDLVLALLDLGFVLVFIHLFILKFSISHN